MTQDRQQIQERARECARCIQQMVVTEPLLFSNRDALANWFECIFRHELKASSPVPPDRAEALEALRVLTQGIEEYGMPEEHSWRKLLQTIQSALTTAPDLVKEVEAMRKIHDGGDLTGKEVQVYNSAINAVLKKLAGKLDERR